MKLLHLFVAVLLAGVVAGCATEPASEALEASDPPAVAPVGPAAAKGDELRPVATVRRWITARGWEIESVRLTRQGSYAAAVRARVVAADGQRHTVDFEVRRVDGSPAVVDRAVRDQ